VMQRQGSVRRLAGVMTDQPRSPRTARSLIIAKRRRDFTVPKVF
jgi:hypothetical protein